VIQHIFYLGESVTMRDLLRLDGGRLMKLLAVTAVVLAAGSNARAAVLAYEGFDYTPNTLLVNGGVGLGGGTGWAGPWDESQALSYATTTQANSLQYTDSQGNVLTTVGGKLLNTGVGDGVTSQTSQPGRTLANRRASPETGATVSTWVSFLGQRIGELDSTGTFAGTYRRGANLAMFDLSGGTQPEKFNIGESSNQQYPLGGGAYEDRWQTRAPGIPAAVVVPQPYPQNPEGSGTSTATGAQVRDAFSQAKFADVGLFVMRIDHVAGSMNNIDSGGNDNVYVWLNPNLSSTPSDATASIKYVSADIVAAAAAVMPTPVAPYNGDGGEFNFDRFRLFAGNVAGTTPFAQWLFDELRVGDTFADVTPHTPGVVGVPGDYNDNGTVDAADYVVWRNNPATLENEGASPGVVDQADYTFWRSRFGAMSGAASNLGAAVPAPSTSLLLAIAAATAISATVTRRTRKFALV
jgi:hypothetical protein